MEGPVELFERTLQAHGRSRNTIRAYSGWLRRFAAFVARPLTKVSLGDLQAYQRHLAADRRVDSSTFNQAFFALRFFYRDCMQKRWDFTRLPSQRKARRLPEILSPDEVEALFEACSNLKHRTVLMTAYGCGLRVSETLALRPAHIDSMRMVVRVEQGKGGVDRYVMLPRRLRAILRKYRRQYRPQEWLFEGRQSGRPLSPKTMQTVFQKVRQNAGITKAVRFHSLRHAFATHLMEEGVSIRIIQTLLGHHSLITTQIYTHLTRRYLNDTTSPLDRLGHRKLGGKTAA